MRQSCWFLRLKKSGHYFCRRLYMNQPYGIEFYIHMRIVLADQENVFSCSIFVVFLPLNISDWRTMPRSGTSLSWTFLTAEQLFYVVNCVFMCFICFYVMCNVCILFYLFTSLYVLCQKWPNKTDIFFDRFLLRYLESVCNKKDFLDKKCTDAFTLINILSPCMTFRQGAYVFIQKVGKKLRYFFILLDYHVRQ